MYVIRLGVRDIDVPFSVKGDSARASELGPGGRVVAFLVENLNSTIASISDEHSTIWIDSYGVQGTELSRAVASLSPGHKELASAAVLRNSVVSVRAMAVCYKHVAVRRDCHITRFSKVIRAVSRFARVAKGKEHFTSGAKFDDMVSTIVALWNVGITHGISHPNIAVGVNVKPMRPNKHPAAKGLDYVTFGIEFQDGV